MVILLRNKATHQHISFECWMCICFVFFSLVLVWLPVRSSSRWWCRPYLAKNTIEFDTHPSKLFAVPSSSTAVLSFFIFGRTATHNMSLKKSAERCAFYFISRYNIFQTNKIENCLILLSFCLLPRDIHNRNEITPGSREKITFLICLMWWTLNYEEWPHGGMLHPSEQCNCCGFFVAVFFLFFFF